MGAAFLVILRWWKFHDGVQCSSIFAAALFTAFGTAPHTSLLAASTLAPFCEYRSVQQTSAISPLLFCAANLQGAALDSPHFVPVASLPVQQTLRFITRTGGVALACRKPRGSVGGCCTQHLTSLPVACSIPSEFSLSVQHSSLSSVFCAAFL